MIVWACGGGPFIWTSSVTLGLVPIYIHTYMLQWGWHVSSNDQLVRLFRALWATLEKINISIRLNVHAGVLAKGFSWVHLNTSLPYSFSFLSSFSISPFSFFSSFLHFLLLLPFPSFSSLSMSSQCVQGCWLLWCHRVRYYFAIRIMTMSRTQSTFDDYSN